MYSTPENVMDVMSYSIQRKILRKDKFKEGLSKARVYVKCFSGAKANQIYYCVVPQLVHEKPSNVVIHIRSNNIAKLNYNSVNSEELAHRIINIGLKWSK